MKTCPTCGALPCDQVESLEDPPADAPLSVHLRGLARSMWPRDAIRPLLERCADALEQSGK